MATSNTLWPDNHPPQRYESYPFKKPYKEVPIIFGEWWNADPALQTGGGPNASDAHTRNGFPGPLYNCSSNDRYRLIEGEARKRYMLRLINAAMNRETDGAIVS